MLVSINGEELARERQYLTRELGTALDEFAQYREASIGLLGTLSEEAWSRSATFEDRSVSLRELVTAMVDHDESHLGALANLLAAGRYEGAHVSEGASAAGVSASR